MIGEPLFSTTITYQCECTKTSTLNIKFPYLIIYWIGGKIRRKRVLLYKDL